MALRLYSLNCSLKTFVRACTHAGATLCSEVMENVAFNMCSSYSRMTLSSDLSMDDSNCSFCK